MASAKAKNKAAAREFVESRDLIGEQIGMAQVDIADSRAESNPSRVEPQSQAARERIVICLGHEDPVETGVFRLLRPFDDGVQGAIGHD
jgi:hypothetical protein